MLKLEFQCFGHLMWRTDSLEKTLMLGKMRVGGEGGDRGWDGWMSSRTQRTWVFVCLFVCFSFIFISWRIITLQYCSDFCHTLTWISHGFTCIPHPDPPSHLPLHSIPLGLPSAPGPSTCLVHPTWLVICFTLDNIHVSMMFSWNIPPSPSPTESKVYSVHLCLFFCFAYRVIITIFLNSIYMC